MDFEKMHGLGNDFIVIDGMEGDPGLDRAQVPALCDRHTGIGADGVIIVRRSEGADGFMDYINADGTYASMCGNGVRVTAKFLVDHGYVSPTGSCVIDTRAGQRQITYTTSDGLLAEATVDMGAPILQASQVPAVADMSAGYGVVEIETAWGQARLVTVSMGNPHAVWFLDPTLASTPADLASLDIAGVGAFLESHEAFPEKANIEFVVPRPDGLHMRVFERGVGETLACGTGACAVQVAAHLAGIATRAGNVHLPGGTLHIDWTGTTVLMTGPAATVYLGRIETHEES